MSGYEISCDNCLACVFEKFRNGVCTLAFRGFSANKLVILYILSFIRCYDLCTDRVLGPFETICSECLFSEY